MYVFSLNPAKLERKEGGDEVRRLSLSLATARLAPISM